MFEITAVSQNKRKRIQRKKRNVKKTKEGKRRLETFRTESSYDSRFLVNLSFCFELYQKSYTLLKDYDLLVRVVAGNPCQTTRF